MTSMSDSQKATVVNVKRTPVVVDSKGTMLGGGQEAVVDLTDSVAAAALAARFIVVRSVPEEKTPTKGATSTPESKHVGSSEVKSEKQKAPAQIVSEEG